MVHGGVASLVSGAWGVVGLVKSMVDEVGNHSVVVKIFAIINFSSLSNYDLMFCSSYCNHNRLHQVHIHA